MNFTEHKLYINSNWMFTCNIFIFCVDLNSKMAATTMGTNILKKFFFVTNEVFKANLAGKFDG